VSARLLATWLACVSAVAGAQARKDVPELGLSVQVPKGWEGELQRDEDNQLSFSLQPLGGDGQAGVALMRRAPPALPPGTTLRQSFAKFAGELTGGAPVKAAGPPEFFTLEGREAGRQYFRGDQQGESIELFVALWPGPETWISAVGAWKVGDSAKMRGAADGLVKGLKALKVEAGRGGVLAAMVGCWNEVQRSTGGVGTGYREATYTFSADGRFTYRSMASADVGGNVTSSQEADEGRWAVSGETLQLQSSKSGETVKLPVAVKGGLLQLRGQRYAPCGK
jgi:hypothetical protein